MNHSPDKSALFTDLITAVELAANQASILANRTDDKDEASRFCDDEAHYRTLAIRAVEAKSAIPTPDYSGLIGALEGLMEWKAQTGGWEAPVWGAAETELRKVKGEPVIQIGDSFLMPEPIDSDNWRQAGWIGTVAGFRDGGQLVTVKDMDDDAFDIEAARLAGQPRA